MSSIAGVMNEKSIQEPLVCVVEVPKGTRNKYEYDPVLGGIRFDRLLLTAAVYPADYGYLRVVVSATTLTIEFHPESDGVTTKTPDDVVTVTLANHTVA